VKVTQWGGDNSNARQILHVKIALAKSELKTLQFLVSDAKQKIFDLNNQFAALSNSEGFTTVEYTDESQ
jgi:hypothetical protein